MRQNPTKDAESRKSLSAIEILGIVVIGGLILVTSVVTGSEWISSRWTETGELTETNSDSAAITGAEQIIHGGLVNPDGYQRRSASVVWRGSTRAGKPMLGVKIDYNVQNAFGGTVRKCEYIFYFRDGDKLRWENKFGREPCDAVQYFDGDEAAIANAMAKVLVEQHY